MRGFVGPSRPVLPVRDDEGVGWPPGFLEECAVYEAYWHRRAVEERAAIVARQRFDELAALEHEAAVARLRAASPSPVAAPVPGVPVPAGAVTGDEPGDTFSGQRAALEQELRGLRKADLRQRASHAGVPVYGSTDDIRQRLLAKAAETWAAEGVRPRVVR